MSIEKDGNQNKMLNNSSADSTPDAKKKVSAAYSIPAFPSAKIQLEIAKNEYEREKSRSDSLDNKAGVYIAAIVTIITVFIQVLPFRDLNTLFSKAGKTSACALTAVLLILLVGFIMSGIAFYSLTKTIGLRNYKRVCLENLTDISLLASPEDQSSEAMIRHFVDIIAHNESLNDDKAENLNKGLFRSIIGFVFISVGTVLLFTIIGWI